MHKYLLSEDFLGSLQPRILALSSSLDAGLAGYGAAASLLFVSRMT